MIHDCHLTELRYARKPLVGARQVCSDGWHFKSIAHIALNDQCFGVHVVFVVMSSGGGDGILAVIFFADLRVPYSWKDALSHGIEKSLLLS